MKTKIFLFTVLLTISVFSCKDKSDDFNGFDDFLDLNYFLTHEYFPEYDSLALLDNVVSFNTDTKEIQFSGIPNNSIKQGRRIILIHKNKILFQLPVFSPANSAIHNNYVILIDNSKCFFLDAYPEIYEKWPDYITERMIKERKENAEKQKKSWDFFIKYLTDADKILKVNY